ncbi:hypothetical protein FOC1_g10000190, partial [Fusarium oxysporum f. sp. cubense race 1]
YTDAIVTLRPSQLQKLESLGLYYNSPEPAIIYIKCGFAINPIHTPRYPGNKHYLFADERARLKEIKGGRMRLYHSTAPACIALQSNWMCRSGWETMFQDTRRHILVALTELPNCRTNQPMPLGIQGEEVIYSLARDERRLASMMVALDRLLFYS